MTLFNSVQNLFKRTARQAAPARRLLLAAGLLLPLVALVPFARGADEATPTAAVKAVVDTVLGILRKPDFSLAKDGATISAEIKRGFDDLAMAQSVLSTNWKNVDAAKQNEFKALLLKTIETTYLGRITVYTNETVEFRGEEVKDNRATVRSVILSKNGEIPVAYKLRKRTDGWFIYDVEVENVSMVNSYRDSYRAVYAKDGIDGLLSQMKAKIAQLEATPVSERPLDPAAAAAPAP
ncbi:MAG: ABC transporter substrate-binding protein [Pseudomonadota bacterium]